MKKLRVIFITLLVVLSFSALAVAQHEVELYATSWCPYCQMARDFFHSRGISFIEYDIEKDTAAAHRKQQLDSRNGVPFAVINGRAIHGFSEAAYERALASRP